MEDFFERIKNTENPEIINGINSNDPYVICDILEQTRGGIYLKDLEDAIIKTNDTSFFKDKDSVLTLS